LVRVERRAYRKPAALTFGEYAASWFDGGPAKRGWKPNTIREYKGVRRRLVERFGVTPINLIRPRAVAAMVDDLVASGYAPATINRELAVLSAIFESALKAELVEANPARRAERPRVVPTRWRLLTPAEVGRVNQAFREVAEAAAEAERVLIEQYRIAFLFVIETGVRRHELIDLQWASVSLVGNTVRINKSKSEAGERTIALSSRLAGELWALWQSTAYQGDEELVFASSDEGQPITPRHLRRRLPQGSQAGWDHGLRSPLP
jgi:integrase